jgi:hypothetical protein
VRRSLLLGSLFTALAAGSALAEVEPIIAPGGQYLAPMTLPKLPKVIGWTPNPSASLLEHARVLLPPGKTLDTTDAIIAARAYPQSMVPGAVTLDAFISRIQASDQETDPDRTAAETTPLSDKAGHRLRVFAFKNGDGAVGEVAYGSEASGGVAYWTSFTISARNAAALSESMASYRDLLANYQ